MWCFCNTLAAASINPMSTISIWLHGVHLYSNVECFILTFPSLVIQPNRLFPESASLWGHGGRPPMSGRPSLCPSWLLERHDKAIQNLQPQLFVNCGSHDHSGPWGKANSIVLVSVSQNWHQGITQSAQQNNSPYDVVWWGMVSWGLWWV